MNTKKIRSISKEMDYLYGVVGSPEREEFRREAYAYCVGQKTEPENVRSACLCPA